MTNKSVFSPTVIVTALGYFIDMFDLFSFNMVRVQSLRDLGLPSTQLTQMGLNIANCQWAGLLIGAYATGVLSDRIGRKKSLILAIIIYSIGSLMSGFVQEPLLYGVSRFLTGLGLAGELGSGVTLISEKYEGRKRGIGVMIFIVLGFAGVIAAASISQVLSWRYVYIGGGVAGALLLLTRTFLPESELFLNVDRAKTKLGGLGFLWRRRDLAKKYFCAILLQLPLIFIPQIVWTLSPELGAAKGITQPIRANTVLLLGFTCVIISDLIATTLSETLRSRKKGTLAFLLAGCPAYILYLAIPEPTEFMFYVCNGLLGLTFGIWVIAATWVAENFGTNIRATVATTVPNFTRATTILLNLIFGSLKGHDPLTLVAIMGVVIYGLSFVGWLGLKETWGARLDFVDDV
ncbi:MAG TPA: MFS transporter [Oculatellaceae cyanobacterium]